MTWLVQATVQGADETKRLTTRDRNGSESDRWASNRHRQKESDWQTLLRLGEIAADGGLDAGLCGM